MSRTSRAVASPRLVSIEDLRPMRRARPGILPTLSDGRQLDCVPASLRALPEVVKAVNGQAEVWMDGGIRRGTDIVKAILPGGTGRVLRTRLCVCLGRGRCGRSGACD